MRRIVALAALGLAGLVLAGCSTSGSSGPALGLVADGQPDNTPIGSFANQGLSTSAQKKAAEAEYPRARVRPDRPSRSPGKTAAAAAK